MVLYCSENLDRKTIPNFGNSVFFILADNDSYLEPRGPFLESSKNFSGPKSHS